MSRKTDKKAMRNSLVRFGKRNVYRPASEAFINSFEDSSYNNRENPVTFIDLAEVIPMSEKNFLMQRRNLNNYLTSKFL